MLDHVGLLYLSGKMLLLTPQPVNWSPKDLTELLAQNNIAAVSQLSQGKKQLGLNAAWQSQRPLSLECVVIAVFNMSTELPILIAVVCLMACELMVLNRCHLTPLAQLYV